VVSKAGGVKRRRVKERAHRARHFHDVAACRAGTPNGDVRHWCSVCWTCDGRCCMKFCALLLFSASCAHHGHHAPPGADIASHSAQGILRPGHATRLNGHAPDDNHASSAAPRCAVKLASPAGAGWPERAQ
jgi:hypothetical protein